MRNRVAVYLLDHFLDELVGGFEIFRVGAVQQASQHLRGDTQEPNSVVMLAPKRR